MSRQHLAHFDALDQAGRVDGAIRSRLAIDGLFIGMYDAVLRSVLGLLHTIQAGDEQGHCGQTSRDGDQGCHVADV